MRDPSGNLSYAVSGRRPIDLGELGAEIFVDFPVRRLSAARVLWLNERWCVENGWDIDGEAQRQRVEQWLIDRFGVISCQPKTADHWMKADRYGGSFGTQHGGSGRCGTIGTLTAKGIGRTPLCAEQLTDHCDGRLSLVEAIREAICSEIAQVELPYGAVPVVAILGFDDDMAGEAIIVRPNTIRPAHFERSIYFGSAGFDGSDQHRDAIRTENAIRIAADGHPNIPPIPEMFRRFAIQIGSCFAHRLWQGRFLSSNVSVSGELVDFGSFRSVPSWRRFLGFREEAFGIEKQYLEAAWKSVRASFEKYQPEHARTWSHIKKPNPWIADCEGAFADSTLGALGVDKSVAWSAPVVAAIQAYADAQQRECLCIGDRWTWRLPWIYDAFKEGGSSNGSLERGLLLQLREIVSCHSHGDYDFKNLIRRLAAWTRPRPEIQYEHTSITLRRLVSQMRRCPSGGRALLATSIEKVLSTAIRAWPSLPGHIEVIAQRHAGHSTVLYCVDHSSGQHVAYVRGTLSPDGVSERIWGRTVSIRGSRQESPNWHKCLCARQSQRTGAVVTLGRVELRLPPASGFFNQTVLGPTIQNAPAFQHRLALPKEAA